VLAIQIVPLFPDAYDSVQSLPVLLTVLSTLVDRYGPSKLGLHWLDLAIRIGNNQTYADLLSSVPVSRMMATWKDGLDTFRTRRRRYLLYTEASRIETRESANDNDANSVENGLTFESDAELQID
jgi:hypothetical protein